MEKSGQNADAIIHSQQKQLARYENRMKGERFYLYFF